jgi:hypothetical protein
LVIAIAIKIVGNCSKLRLGQLMCLLSSAICVTCMICVLFSCCMICAVFVFFLCCFFYNCVDGLVCVYKGSCSSY